ncbi:hypothetical protein SAMN02745127_01734 [Oceanospirillum multiglobuliferum]|uniref:Uncharacterized protein n=1 Tax=Oceanospirillum multiglobuliferum TaxID=64969 RepID=A0A1T4Q2P3_9GAMM|nr:hypothetical protein [Oceanospirillum multiglobuliferum]OPX55493.1 hypothetical protein BTE48_08890 [Oceanospirillum multiglobuliferum]SJZ98070.1 hypothetical protein SAMN02745127_01734 [Oceanospirillum multiglobuliferum]
MLRQVKVSAVIIASVLAVGCAAPQGYYGQTAAAPVYVQLPPEPPQPPRQIIIRTETHRVLRPRIVMEPCCRMEPSVLYVR